jgi:hypothetical protein
MDQLPKGEIPDINEDEEDMLSGLNLDLLAEDADADADETPEPPSFRRRFFRGEFVPLTNYPEGVTEASTADEGEETTPLADCVVPDKEADKKTEIFYIGHERTRKEFRAFVNKNHLNKSRIVTQLLAAFMKGGVTRDGRVEVPSCLIDLR